ALLSTLFVLATLSLGYDDAFLYKGGMSLIAILCTGLVYCACVEKPLSNSRLSAHAGPVSKVLKALGRISFSLYVYHMPLVVFFADDTAAALVRSEAVRLMCAAVTTIVAAALSYELVERRILRWKLL
ncbi:MAG: hypothetical protein AAGC91_12470, partial [Pseudomonadota bacterium]